VVFKDVLLSRSSIQIRRRRKLKLSDEARAKRRVIWRRGQDRPLARFLCRMIRENIQMNVPRWSNVRKSHQHVAELTTDSRIPRMFNKPVNGDGGKEKQHDITWPRTKEKRRSHDTEKPH